MTLTTPRPRTAPTTGSPTTSRRARAVLLGLGLAAVAAVAAALPAWPAGDDMGSTHYMGLLAANQPWNLLLFMAVPVVLAETVAVTELVLLVARTPHRAVARANAVAGFVGGVYFLGVTAYLVRHAVVPLTEQGGWRGPADVVAVGFYLLGLVPLLGLTLLEARVVGSDDEGARRRLHATFVGAFLVVAHIAMIAGMLDPSVLGWSPAHVMPDGSTMTGMVMP